MFSSFEVKLDDRHMQMIKELTMLPEWDAFEIYCSMLLDKNRDELEKKDDDLLRGECRRLRRILRLRTELPNVKR